MGLCTKLCLMRVMAERGDGKARKLLDALTKNKGGVMAKPSDFAVACMSAYEPFKDGDIGDKIYLGDGHDNELGRIAEHDKEDGWTLIVLTQQFTRAEIEEMGFTPLSIKGKKTWDAPPLDWIPEGLR